MKRSAISFLFGKFLVRDFSRMYVPLQLLAFFFALKRFCVMEKWKEETERIYLSSKNKKTQK